MSEQKKNSNPGLGTYYLLGRSGLRVSPLCLGTMTFGEDWGWGCDEATAKAVMRAYAEAGGNFIDTADMYTGGHSEEIIGRAMAEDKNRDQLVVATKFTFSTRPSDPNAGGNGRKHIIDAVHASLRRLQTDYIDLYWMHVWDTMTPAEEVMETLDGLVRAGKIRYFGFSDVPAWYLARAQTLAEWRGWTKLVALQVEYNLLERLIEHEHVPAARELGLGICPWSPLASGMLSGKYSRADVGKQGDARLSQTQGSGNRGFERFTERNFKILDLLLEVAKELGRSPAQVAINWATRRPGVVSTIIGARKLDQLKDNIAALDFEIPSEAAAKLDEAGKLDKAFPYYFFEEGIQARIRGERPVKARPDWY